MVSYAIGCGVAPMAAVSIYSVEGLAGLGGRLLSALLADRFGVKPVLIAGLSGPGGRDRELSRWSASSASSTRSSVIFGAAYGGVMPLYAVLAREYFGQRIMGTVFGATTMVSSVGMAFGPWAGGRIFDAFNSYMWLYIGASTVALGAVAVAPSPSRRGRRRAAAAGVKRPRSPDLPARLDPPSGGAISTFSHLQFCAQTYDDHRYSTAVPTLPGRGLRTPAPDGAFGLFRDRHFPARIDLERLRCLRQAAL